MKGQGFMKKDRRQGMWARDKGLGVEGSRFGVAILRVGFGSRAWFSLASAIPLTLTLT